MSIFVCDVEMDGRIIGVNSLVCFGLVKLTPELDTIFYGQVKPISKEWLPESLAISGFSREEHEKFDEPAILMPKLFNWINDNTKGRPILMSDNNGNDAAWLNYYFQVYCGSNPFGWSSRRIGDLFCGAEHDLHYSWKKHRKTRHTHNPVDDAMGNAEALLYFLNKYNMKIPK